MQINEFEKGGIAIGLGLTHMHADPTCATLLVKSWAEQNRRAAIGHPPFCLPAALRGRASPATKTESVRFYEAKSMAQPSPGSVKMRTATLRFPESTVQALLSEIHPRCPEATAFDALGALFWWRAAANRPGGVVADEHSLTVCADFRKLLHAPLPHGFYGNAMHFTKVSVDGARMEGGGLGELAAAMRSHLSRVEEEEYWSVIDWAESRRGPEGKFPPPFQMYGPELTVVNLEHLLAYSAAFTGDQRPLHFSCRVEKAGGEGLILVLPSPDEGLGRTVTVTLPDEQLAKMCQDEAVLRPGVTLVVSDRR